MQTGGLTARISSSLLHRGDRASTCEKVAIKEGVSKSLETSFLLMALFFSLNSISIHTHSANDALRY